MAQEALGKILSQISSPTEVQELSFEELEELADELRRLIISTVSKNGGHLAPSLGVVELTLAMLSVFDPGVDKIVWDVGHQAYAYKILTGRAEQFQTLRTLHGISGFSRRAESPYDHFGVGHSSTSISAALGFSVARDLNEENSKSLAVIGDGSMTAGLAYEGLNQAGGLDRDLIVVLNDNEMSISKNVGALSSFLSRKLSSRRMVRFKRDIESWMRQIPHIGDELANYARRSEESLKGLFTPGMLFEAFKFNYIGPIDGHDLTKTIEVFQQVKDLEGPVLVHVLTQKGKGYSPAETDPTHFHGVGCFEPETGEVLKFGTCKAPSYNKVFGETLCQLAEDDPRIIAITAAMPEGTGLNCFAQKFPKRFFDVGICEQHAVTFAAGLAAQGFKPVVAIYSTFLQRSYDQIVHDVCLQDLPVTFCLDRGGLVGEDGATHHGAFDLSYLRHIPNMTLMAPKDEAELQRMLLTSVNHNGPAAIRYPRGAGLGVALDENLKPLETGRGELLKEGGDALIVAVGSRVYPAWETLVEVEMEHSCSLALFNARFIKPLPEKQLLELAARFERILVVEENTRVGGFSSALLECLADNNAFKGQTIKRIGLPDAFIEHGPQKELRQIAGVDRLGIKKALLELLG